MTRETQPAPIKNRLGRRVLCVTAVLAVAMGSPCAASTGGPISTAPIAQATGTNIDIIPGVNGTLVRTTVGGKTQQVRAKRSRSGNGKVRFRASGKRGSDSYTKLEHMSDSDVKWTKGSFKHGEGLNYKEFPASREGDEPGSFRYVVKYENGKEVSRNLMFVPDDPDTGKPKLPGLAPRLTKADVLDMALGELFLPVPNAEYVPKLDSTDFPPLVQMPLVWHSSNAQRASSVASAGGITVTTTAVPIMSYGTRHSDKAVEKCTGGGVAWSRGLDVTKPQVCEFIFEKPVKDERLVAGVVYDITYVATTAGSRETGSAGIAAVEIESDPVNINERHALGTR